MTNKQLRTYIGERLFELRGINGLTQEYAAKKIGLTRASIINMEKGKHMPRPFMFYKICKLYKCTPNDIYPNE